MTEFSGSAVPRIVRWPFLLGDILVVGVALVCYAHGQHWPFGGVVGLAPWEGWVLTVSIFLGAALGVLPFVLEYRVGSRLDELERVQTGLQQLKNIEHIGRQIHSATASWQAVQDDAAKAVAAASGLQERMATEAQAFQEFLSRAQDTERAHLRLEVEKLRRGEGEWLQALVRVLDHIWALHQAAVRSGKVNLVEQLSLFQRACRDAAQRVGLVPFMAPNGERFDAELHQPVEGTEVDLSSAHVRETVATGFRFQGQMVRKALVVLGAPGTEETEPATDSAGTGQTEFTRQLASDFRVSADTAFVRALSGEGRSAEERPGTPGADAAESEEPGTT